MAELPIAPIKRLLKNAGADRVSDEATHVLAEHVEDQIALIAENSVNMAQHAGRKTVQAEDIELSIKTLYE